jgi:transposase
VSLLGKVNSQKPAYTFFLTASRTHPEQGFRACLGIIRLARFYGHERLDAAAMRAIDIGARTYGSVKSILANNLDRRPSPKRSADDAPILHPNIRGPRYYN